MGRAFTKTENRGGGVRSSIYFTNYITLTIHLSLVWDCIGVRELLQRYEVRLGLVVGEGRGERRKD